MTPHDRMILRLCAGPAALLVLSVPTAVLRDWILDLGGAGRFAPIIANGLAPAIGWASVALAAGGLLWLAYTSWRLWRWASGKTGEPTCWNCGGLMGWRNGRYGPYLKCLACGRNEGV